jgi:hypothetical protein
MKQCLHCGEWVTSRVHHECTGGRRPRAASERKARKAARKAASKTSLLRQHDPPSARDADGYSFEVPFGELTDLRIAHATTAATDASPPVTAPPWSGAAKAPDQPRSRRSVRPRPAVLGSPPLGPEGVSDVGLRPGQRAPEPVRTASAGVASGLASGSLERRVHALETKLRDAEEALHACQRRLSDAELRMDGLNAHLSEAIAMNEAFEQQLQSARNRDRKLADFERQLRATRPGRR